LGDFGCVRRISSINCDLLGNIANKIKSLSTTPKPWHPTCLVPQRWLCGSDLVIGGCVLFGWESVWASGYNGLPPTVKSVFGFAGTKMARKTIK